ncbi:polysaccharide export protein EpsE [Limnobacter parvus]|uniref:Polysaccharide export protein EpsE n=1 Tax=Limnobacter parvus TaxID=2939690 RepID=A0ABT1XF59_9BURK|nr:polysaccharide export protein EpsE [Limnobacter parvus]MCR2745918.1 polysaccharide export protein EpsE [Limnobacter parvus]
MIKGLLSLLAFLSALTPLHASEESREYRLGGGDLISVTVFQNPDFTGDRRVSENGEITFPLIGAVAVGNLTIREAEQVIAERLSDGQFVVGPQVSIVPIEMRSAQISVIGFVSKPGRYPLDSRNTRLSDALSMAGGVIQSAPTVSLNGGDLVVLKGTRNGEPYSKTIDLREIFLKGNDDLDVLVVGGDTLYVGRAPQYYVYGEVQRPGVYKIETGMTVRQALAQAGGLTPRGSQNGIQIFRKDAQGTESLIKPDLDQPLQDNDTLFFKQSFF